MLSSEIEPLSKQALAFKKKIDKVMNKPCSAMFKLNDLMDIILSLKLQIEKPNSLSQNDMDVISALLNRAMKTLESY